MSNVQLAILLRVTDIAIRARAGGPVDGTRIGYVSPVYKVYPLGFSSRYACPATGMAQRRERGVSFRSRSIESLADAAVDGA